MILNYLLFDSAALRSDRHGWSSLYDNGICKWRYSHFCSTATVVLYDLTPSCESKLITGTYYASIRHPEPVTVSVIVKIAALN